MDFYEYLEEKAKNGEVNKIVVGAVITNKNGKILLLKRKQDDFMGGIFEIPSGNVEKGEKLFGTLTREIKEETNLNLKKVNAYINYFDYLSSSGKKSRQFNFKIEVKKNEIKLTEHDEYKWISLSEIEQEEAITDDLKNTLMIYKFNEECQ